jgi:hypothetical protein
MSFLCSGCEQTRSRLLPLPPEAYLRFDRMASFLCRALFRQTYSSTGSLLAIIRRSGTTQLNSIATSCKAVAVTPLYPRVYEFPPTPTLGDSTAKVTHSSSPIVLNYTLIDISAHQCTPWTFIRSFTVVLDVRIYSVRYPGVGKADIAANIYSSAFLDICIWIVYNSPPHWPNIWSLASGHTPSEISPIHF